jgi:hypothetical protein
MPFTSRASLFLFALLLPLLATTLGYPQAPEPTLPYDYSQAKDSYANFIHLTQSPDEVFFDFGVNINHPAAPKEKVKMGHRVAMNYYTAKRMQSLLNQAIERHEKLFGPIEVDPQKRVKPMKEPPSAE